MPYTKHMNKTAIVNGFEMIDHSDADCRAFARRQRAESERLARLTAARAAAEGLTVAEYMDPFRTL